MMIYPPITKLVEKTGSRYTLVIETAKRARQLSEGSQALSHCDSTKEVSIATNEIYEDKLSFFHSTDTANQVSDITEDLNSDEI